MTEKEYIHLSNLTKIRTILDLLRDLQIEAPVAQDERNSIEGRLIKWRKKLEESINIDDD